MQDQDGPLQLQDLPFEIISLVLSYLPLRDLIPVTLLSQTLFFVASSPTTTPFHPPIRELLDHGPPYPRALETLGTYTHIPRSVFLPVLVRASPQWILERMVMPAGITEEQWQQCFLARFLPSWTRYRETDVTWRAAFMRVLARLVHRHQGCTHEESWTRFIILHRNGTASINRIYSRTFDPLTIYAEIRRQNDLLRFGQEVRLVCQLQDVRVLMLGTMAPPESLFVNPNAYAVVHPPGLEERVLVEQAHGKVTVGILPKIETPPPEAQPQPQPQPEQHPPQTQRNGFPRTRSLSFGRHPPPPESTNALTTLVNRLRPPTGRTSSHRPSDASAGRRLSWLGRTRSREPPQGQGQTQGLSRSTTRASQGAGTDGSVDSFGWSVPHRDRDEPGGEASPLHTPEAVVVPSPPAPSVPAAQLVYPVLKQPSPAPSHALYPNWTPHRMDSRSGRRVARDKLKYLASAVPVGAEYDDENGWRTWIGPVLLIAQLAPATEYSSIPAPSLWVDEPPAPSPRIIDGPATAEAFGPPGMYASFDWADLDALVPWLELQQVQGGNEGSLWERFRADGTHRAGLGFAR